MRHTRGFTLIELLVVISIIALLLSVLIPSLGLAKESARRLTCSMNLKTIGQATFTYAMANKDYLMPCLAEGDSSPSAPLTYYAYKIHNNPYYSDGQIRNLEHVIGGPYNLGYLFASGLIETPEVFYCPSALRAPTVAGAESHNYDGYHDEGHPWPWNTNITGSNFNLDKVRTSYNYLPQNGRTKDSRGFASIARKTTELSPGLTMTVDYMISLGELAHKKRGSASGLNAMYFDGSVSFKNNSDAFDSRLWDPSPNGAGAINWENFRKILNLLQ